MKKFEFVIEFQLPGGGKMKVNLEADSPDDALDELFKAIRAKTKIHAVDKPLTERNKRADDQESAEELIDTVFGKMRVNRKGKGSDIIDDLLNQFKNGK